MNILSSITFVLFAACDGIKSSGKFSTKLSKIKFLIFLRNVSIFSLSMLAFKSFISLSSRLYVFLFPWEGVVLSEVFFVSWLTWFVGDFVEVSDSFCFNFCSFNKFFHFLMSCSVATTTSLSPLFFNRCNVLPTLLS